jgi:lactoylglutathione lyase
MTDRPNRFHLSMNVPADRFEQTAAFYTVLFGAQPVKRKPDYAKFEPVEPYVNFTLNSVPHAPHGEVDHLGIQVFSDDTLRAARARIVAAGLTVRDEQEVECCYAGQNKFWVSDPTGRQVEFFHVLRDVEQHGRTGLKILEGTATACCAAEPKADAGSTTGCC